MGSKKKLTKREILLSSYLGILQRLYSWFAFQSGLLEVKRKRLAQAGLLPGQILRYQRVSVFEKQAYPLLPTVFVTPETFEKQMTYLAKKCRPISLEDLITHIENNQVIHDKTVVITFDGGWRDIYDYAFPILAHLRIPATVFLPTAFIDTMNLFWQDQIIASMLNLEQAGVKFPDLPFFEMSPEGENDGGNDSAATRFAYSMTRILHLIDYLSRASPEERFLCLSVLGEGVNAIGGLPIERVFLSWDEVRSMENRGISFGSNGHIYRPYGECKKEEIAEDIKLSYATLTEQKVNAVRVFSYPEGSITKESREILFQAGIPFSVGIGSYERSTSKKETSALLSRLDMYESVSYATDLFASRLGGLKFLGRSY